MDTVARAADMVAFDHVNMDRCFYGYTSIASVSGLSNLCGTREIRYVNEGCPNLASIDLSGFGESSFVDGARGGAYRVSYSAACPQYSSCES